MNSNFYSFKKFQWLRLLHTRHYWKRSHTHTHSYLIEKFFWWWMRRMQFPYTFLRFFFYFSELLWMHLNVCTSTCTNVFQKALNPVFIHSFIDDDNKYFTIHRKKRGNFCTLHISHWKKIIGIGIDWRCDLVWNRNVGMLCVS